MSITDLIVNTSIIQNTLSSGSLTSIDMGHNADIAFFFNVYGAGHGVPPKRDACRTAAAQGAAADRFNDGYYQR